MNKAFIFSDCGWGNEVEVVVIVAPSLKEAKQILCEYDLTEHSLEQEINLQESGLVYSNYLVKKKK